MDSSSFSSSSNMSSKRSGGIRRNKSNARRTLDTTSNTSTTSYKTTKETTNNNDSDDEPDASNMNETLTLLLEMNIDMSKQLNEVSKKLDNLVILRKEQQKEKENHRQQEQQQLNGEKKKLLEKVNEIGKSFEKNMMESFELRMNCLESKFDKILKDLHHSSKEGSDDGVAGVTLSNDSSSAKETNSTIASCSTLDGVNSDREDERQRASSTGVIAAESEECHDKKDDDDEMEHFVTSGDSLSFITPQENEQEKEESSSTCVVSSVSKKQEKKKRRKNYILDCYQIDDGDNNYCSSTKKRQRKVSVSKEDEVHQVQAYSNNKTHITNNEKEILLPLQPTPEDLEWERQLDTYLQYTNDNINMMMMNDENAVKKNASTMEAWATNQIYSFQNYIKMDESESESESKDCNSNTDTLNEYRAERLRELRLFLPDTIENCYRSASKRNRKEENNNTCHQHLNKNNIQNRQHCHQEKETHERSKVVITTTTTPSPVRMTPQQTTISSSNTTSTSSTSKQSKHLHHHQEKETHERSKMITTTTTTPSPVMMTPQQTTISSSNTTATSSTSKQPKKQQDHNNSVWNSHFTDMVNYIQNKKNNENENDNEDEFILVLDKTKMGSTLYRWISRQRSLWKKKKLIKYPDRIEKLSKVQEFMDFCDVDTNIEDNNNDEVPHSTEKQNEKSTTNNTTHATTSTSTSSTSKQSKHLHHHQEKETHERSKMITTTTTTPSPVMMTPQQTTISSSNTTATKTSTKRSIEEYQNERNSIWNSNFTDMVNYIQNMKNNEDENILVLNKTKMGSTLYNWIVTQRSWWKRKLIKQQDRIEKLSKMKEFIELCDDTNNNDGLPRYTEKQNEAWKGRFEELSDFYNIHGHSNYIHSKDNHDNTNGEKNCNKINKGSTPLAGWIRRQRKTYSEGKLERSRIYRLESINFEWTHEDEIAAVQKRERGETSNSEESDDGEDPMYPSLSFEKGVSEEERIRQQQEEEEAEYNNMTEDEKREIYEYNEFLRNQAFDEDEQTE